MKKNLFTFSVLILSFFLFSAGTFAQEVPGGDSNGIDTLNIEYGLAIETKIKLTNYPNPIHVNTTLEYSIPSDGTVSLKVYNSAGQQVATVFRGYKTAGTYTVEYNALNLPSGIYVCKLSLNARERAITASRLLKVSK